MGFGELAAVGLDEPASEEPEGGPQAAALGRLGSAPPSRSPSGVTGDTRAQLMEVLSRLSSSGSLAAPSSGRCRVDVAPCRRRWGRGGGIAP